MSSLFLLQMAWTLISSCLPDIALTRDQMTSPWLVWTCSEVWFVDISAKTLEKAAMFSFKYVNEASIKEVLLKQI